ncbi:NUDIX domain-containing protein [Candidatus Dojkabacteria bacterium]|nr:NUDIX domain-containing protein [Candidatus Dojkabacteria bacterium]
MTKSVLVFLLQKDKSNKKYICLGRKKTGHGIGKWNGFGGKQEKGETSPQAARREIYEESNVKVNIEDLHLTGKIKYFEPTGNWSVDVYICEKWDGKISPTNEMEPKWFLCSEVPYEQMWPNDRIWLPNVLESRKFKIHFFHDIDGNLLKKVEKPADF